MGKPYNTNYNTIKNSDYNTDKDRVMMMNITDELRNFANSGMSAMECAAYSDKLIAIADRIDMEHERRMEERADRYSELRTILKERYVELPEDAEKVSWNIGDRDEDGNEITELRLTTNGWCILTDNDWLYCHEQHRHYHAPTVEAMLMEFGIDWEHESDYVDRAALLKEYAVKFRLAEGED